MNFQRILQRLFWKTSMIFMNDYGLERSEKMEQVWGLYVGTGLYISEQLFSCGLIECISPESLFGFFCYRCKKYYFDEKPFHFFWTP